jgi:conjugal transfer ATP-binding protein TraC
VIARISADRSLTMRLPQWDLRDGVAVSQDGVLEGGIEIQIPPTTLLPYASAEALHLSWMATLRNAIPQNERLRLYIEASPLGERVIREYEGGVTSKHPQARTLTDRKVKHLLDMRSRGELIQLRAYLTFTVHPKRKRKPRKAYLPDEFSELHKIATLTRQKLMAMLSRMKFNPRPLTTQDLYELMWRYYNPARRASKPPEFVPTRVHVEHSLLRKHPYLADRTLRSQLVKSDMPVRNLGYFHYDDTYWGIISMQKLPVGMTYTNMLNHMLRTPHYFWLVIDFEHNPHSAMIRELTTKARRYHSAASDTTFSDYADSATRVGLQETDGAVTQATASGSHFFNLGLSLVILESSREKLERGVQHVMSELAGVSGLEAMRESLALTEQFLALSPGSGRNNERLFNMLEENATAFIPTSSPWVGAKRPVTLFWNRYDSVTSIDPFDPRSTNWNGIVIGGSGSGKTFWMQCYLHDLLRQDTDVMIVDRGYGYKHLVDTFGGVTIPIEPQNGVSINPFDLFPGQTAPDEERKAFLAALIKTMLGARGGAVSGSQDGVIDAAITQAYARATSQRRNPETGEVEVVFTGVQLRDFVRVLLTLEEVGDRSISDIERTIAKQLVADLQGWTGDTALGSFIDRPTNISTDAPIIYYETTGLEANPQLRAVGVLLIADLVWRRVKKDPARKKIVVFDEMWAMLKIPEAAAFIVELYRRFRRYNAAAYSVTQSLQDFLTPEARGILQNTNYHFLLRLPGEDDIIRELFNLPDTAMEAFRSLSGQRGSYSEFISWLRREDGIEGDVLLLRPMPYEYWLFTTHPADMVMRNEALARHNGDLTKALDWLCQHHPKGADS